MNWEAKWLKRRADLSAIGGWDNEMMAVPAGPVRRMIEDGETMAMEIDELRRQIERLRASSDGLE